MKARTTFPLTLFALAALAMTASAAPSEKYAQFAEGPEQFLMTKQDQQQWKKLETDEEAAEFIELFWARRDPTPGTPRNEFREEFQARVAYADQVYRSARTRGALTDMGRVYLLLGPPREARNLGLEGEGTMVSGGVMSRALGRQTFTYDNAIRLNLTGEINFVQNSRGEYKLDFQKGGVAGALTTAINRAVVNPNLKEVPNWSRVEAPETEIGGDLVVQKVVDVEMVPKVLVPDEKIGATQLTLLKDVFTLQPQSGKDPLEGVTGVSSFTRSDELGWAAQYCGNSDVVRVSMLLNAKINGKNVSMAAPSEEMAPDAIKVRPGCYLVRGAVPLEEMEQGEYQLSVQIEDPVTKKAYDLRQTFRLE